MKVKTADMGKRGVKKGKIANALNRFNLTRMKFTVQYTVRKSLFGTNSKNFYARE